MYSQHLRQFLHVGVPAQHLCLVPKWQLPTAELLQWEARQTARFQAVHIASSSPEPAKVQSPCITQALNSNRAGLSKRWKPTCTFKGNIWRLCSDATWGCFPWQCPCLSVNRNGNCKALALHFWPAFLQLSSYPINFFSKTSRNQLSHSALILLNLSLKFFQCIKWQVCSQQFSFPAQSVTHFYFMGTFCTSFCFHQLLRLHPDV